MKKTIEKKVHIFDNELYMTITQLCGKH